jgi:anionic cell wall polymer biosynthesis LytR-Cps2A-Psr (LCP) family protein
MIDKKRKWSIKSPKAQKVHKAIAKMIAVDIQPYLIVDYSGFNELIGVLEPRYVLPS